MRKTSGRGSTGILTLFRLKLYEQGHLPSPAKILAMRLLQVGLQSNPIPPPHAKNGIPTHSESDRLTASLQQQLYEEQQDLRAISPTTDGRKLKALRWTDQSSTCRQPKPFRFSGARSYSSACAFTAGCCHCSPAALADRAYIPILASLPSKLGWNRATFRRRYRASCVLHAVFLPPTPSKVDSTRIRSIGLSVRLNLTDEKKAQCKTRAI
jgi:hypothetical protein